MKSILFGLLIAALIFTCQGASWSGAVKTDSGSWYLTRESSNLSFSMDQKVEGQISPVNFRTRTLSPYHSYYKDLSINKIWIKERTAALQGSLSSEELLKLDSHTNSSVNATILKPAGTDIYTIEFIEKWPVRLSNSKSMSYSGKEINNRDFVGNNQDFIGANFLYSHEFSKERKLNMSLERLNASILATDEAIYSAEVMATRDTEYRLQAHSTGIANFKYRQVDVDNEIQNEGDERYVGVFDIVKNMRMKSRFETIKKEDDWMPCCSGGFAGMNPLDQRAFKSAIGVFDCTCFTVPAEAQYPRQ